MGLSPATNPVDHALRRWSACVVAALLCYSILTLWVRQRWAISFLQFGVFALGAAWSARMIVRPFALRGAVLLLPLGGVALWGFIQLALGRTVYRLETWEESLYWLTAFVLVALAVQVFQDQTVRGATLRALLYFGFAISILATVQLFTSEGKVFWIFPSGYTDMVIGPFVYHNDYAAFVELLLPLALFQALRGRDRATLYAAITAVLFASVIASASRAGAVLVTLEVLAVLVIALVRRMITARQLGRAMVKIAFLAFLFTAVVGWKLLWNRFQMPDPFIYRREMLASSLAMARERPWFGFGLGTFQTAYPAYALFDVGLLVNHAHNDWAEWLAEGGIPFLGMMLWLAGWSAGPAVRSVWGIGVLSVFLHAMVDYPTQRLGLAVWLWVMLAALAAWDARSKQRGRPGLDPEWVSL